jgi:hypothetical protein
MPVLVITSDQVLAQEIRKGLPLDSEGIFLQDIKEFQIWSEGVPAPDKAALAVLLEVKVLPQDLDQIREIKALTTGKELAVLAIIQNITFRGTVLDAGADDYLLRPCDERELVARLKIKHSPGSYLRGITWFEEELKRVRNTTAGRLVPGLIHELNNQLQAIQGSLALAVEELDDPQELKSLLEMSLEGSEKMSDMIDQMRLSYRLPGAEQPEYDLNQYLKQVDALVGKDLSAQKVQLTVDLDERPLYFNDAGGYFQVVLLNLVFKLADATGAAGGDLRLACRMCAQTIEITLTAAGAIEPVDLSFEKQALDGCQGEINYIRSQGMVKMCLPLVINPKSWETEHEPGTGIDRR